MMAMIPPTEAAGWVHLLKAALLVCIRISGLFVFAPIFSSQALPAKVKSVFLAVLTVVLAPVAAALPGSHVEVGLESILGELGVAALLGLSLAMLNELASFAGQLLGMQFSFSLVNLLDPNSEVQTPLLGQMLSLLEITVLLAAGLHRTILAALLHTFLVVPLGSGLAPRNIGLPLVGMMGGVFLAALQLAAPVISATLLVEVGIALMSRVSPQLPVLALTVPAKTVLGYVVLVGSLALWPAFFEARFDGLLNNAQRMLQMLAIHAS
jgi:flagellar biosynthetic protein FliR